jgi:hypothetical protein
VHRVREGFISSAVAMLAFVLGFALTFFVGISATSSSDCDGPCFDQWDDVIWVALVVGALAGIVVGVVGVAPPHQAEALTVAYAARIQPASVAGVSIAMRAHDQPLLRDHSRDVLRRPWASALPCPPRGGRREGPY